MNNNYYRHLFFVFIISNLFAFDFYGLKSGMSYEEVINDYLKFDIKSYCIADSEYDKENYSYSHKDKTIEEMASECEKLAMAEPFTIPSDNDALKRIKESEYVSSTEYMGNINALMDIPYIKKISFLYTPNNEVLYGITVLFELDIEIADKFNAISNDAFNQVLKDTFPNGAFQKVEDSKYNLGPQTIMVLMDSKVRDEWLKKYSDQIDKF
tara:strand:+ start:179 stop:811 length:633 start_codon:yes stop_codon:yes gene_type:complete